jgi:hypothetical protein
MNKYQAILLMLLVGIHPESRGDSCPSPDKIRHRDLSKQYEWTVDEKTTLQNLLSVQKLYAVRIMDHGLYVSCYYTTDKWPVKLDVAPVKDGCKYASHQGKWKSIESGQDVCMEKNAGNCGFKYTCKQAQ